MTFPACRANLDGMESKKTNEHFASVAELVADAMEQRGLTIRDLAIKLGLTYEHIRRVVRGEAIPSKFILKPMCDELGIAFDEVDQIATGEKIRKKYGAIPVDLTPRDPDLSVIEKLWRQLSKGHRKDALSMMQTWAKSDRIVGRAG